MKDTKSDTATCIFDLKFPYHSRVFVENGNLGMLRQTTKDPMKYILIH